MFIFRAKLIQMICKKFITSLNRFLQEFTSFSSVSTSKERQSSESGSSTSLAGATTFLGRPLKRPQNTLANGEYKNAFQQSVSMEVERCETYDIIFINKQRSIIGHQSVTRINVNFIFLQLISHFYREGKFHVTNRVREWACVFELSCLYTCKWWSACVYG